MTSPKITRLSLRRLWSLYDITMFPQAMSVIVGANGSGKTNIAEALDFVGSVHRDGLEIAVGKKGGVQSMEYRRERRRKSELGFVIDIELPITNYTAHGATEKAYQFRHELYFRTIDSDDDFSFEVTSECIELSRKLRSGTSRTYASFRRSPDHIDVALENKRAENFFSGIDFESWRENLPATASLIEFLRAIDSFFRQASVAVGQAKVYRISPMASRMSGIPASLATLGTHGHNLPSVVHFMRKHQPAEWELVLDAMRRILPGLEDVEPDFTTDKQLTITFKEEGIPKPWGVGEVSDGTVQALALFSAMFDRRVHTLFIEEPENSIHPWIIQVFLDRCRGSNKQILITTHSPVVLNLVAPSEVIVAWREKSRTHVRELVKIDPDVESMWANGSTVYDMVSSGFISQAVPGQF